MGVKGRGHMRDVLCRRRIKSVHHPLKMESPDASSGDGTKFQFFKNFREEELGHSEESRRRAYAKLCKRRADWFAENGPCRKCGSWDQLELDHIEPSDKEHHVIWSWSEERRQKELQKCQVLCHWCHLDKSMLENMAGAEVHGVSAYKSSRCRCDICKAAVAEYTRQWRIRNGGRVAKKNLPLAG
jgi:hypothetical protein